MDCLLAQRHLKFKTAPAENNHMQNERDFLTQQVFILQQRITQIPQGERPASNKLLRSFDIRNQTLIILRKSLVEIMGPLEADMMVDEATMQAEEWHAGLKKSC